MSIRAATLNVWSLPGPLAKHKPQRMIAITERVAELRLDVVAFQEVWTQASRETLIEGGMRAGFEHVWHNPETTGGSGLLVLSKLPILDSRFEAFAARGHADRVEHMDYYSGKGFALVTLETASGPVTLLTTHLHANYAYRGAVDEYRGIRAAQVIQLVAAILKVRTPLIAVGDFNIDDAERSYQVLRGLTSVVDAAESLDATQPTSMAANPYHRIGHIDKRIDYVFYRNGEQQGLQPISIQSDFAAPLDFDGELGAYSDHAGLVAEFVFAASVGGDLSFADEMLSAAAELIAEGRAISDRRRSKQRFTATGALAIGLATLGGSRNTSENRRRFVKSLLRFASGMSFAIFAGNLGLSEWINPKELAAYDDAEQQLARIRADLRRT